MAQTSPAERPLWARRHPLDAADGARRTTAYVYGNVLVLAALAVVSTADVTDGHAFWLVLGTALSTFVAHVFAETMGDQVKHPEPVTARNVLRLARESLPILTSGLLPAVILLAGWWGWLAPDPAVLLADAVVLLRIAGTGIVVARLRNERSSVRIFAIGIGMAVVGAAISGLKVYLTH
ncbi:hypothetical protein ACVBEQ_27220 [Nakamurella sp. GG22]